MVTSPPHLPQKILSQALESRKRGKQVTVAVGKTTHFLSMGRRCLSAGVVKSITEFSYFACAAEPPIDWVWRGRAATPSPQVTVPWTGGNYLIPLFQPQTPSFLFFSYVNILPIGSGTTQPPSTWLAASGEIPVFLLSVSLISQTSQLFTILWGEVTPEFHCPLSSYPKHTYSQWPPHGFHPTALSWCSCWVGCPGWDTLG